MPIILRELSLPLSRPELTRGFRRPRRTEKGTLALVMQPSAVCLPIGFPFGTITSEASGDCRLRP